jgi:hypothetical protein
LKITKNEIEKKEDGRQIKMFNRAIEPNDHAVMMYRAAVDNLSCPLLNHQNTSFDISKETFEEYKERQKDPMKFHMVHFIHSIYHVDIEQAFVHCFDNELLENGRILCIVEGKYLIYNVVNLCHGGTQTANVRETAAEKIIQIANKHGWKHKVFDGEDYNIDVTDVFDEKSTEGNLLLDFLTQTMNFRAMADQQLVEETLELIKDLTVVESGRYLGEKKECLLFIYR